MHAASRAEPRVIQLNEEAARPAHTKAIGVLIGVHVVAVVVGC